MVSVVSEAPPSSELALSPVVRFVVSALFSLKGIRSLRAC
jgi:hypothetical protein